MKRLLVTSLSLAFATMAMAQEITFQTRATTLDRALEALSRANNVQVRAVGPVARQVVVINVKKQPLDLFLKRLTSVLAASANLNNGVYEVADNQALIKAEDDADRARVAKSFAKQIAEQSKGLSQNAQSEEDIYKRLNELKQIMDQIQANPDNPNNLYERAQSLQESIPTAQLVRRLLATIPPADLAALPTDQRVVYANNPTRMQRALNGQAQRVLQQFGAEFSNLMSAVNRFPKEQRDDFSSLMGSYTVMGVPTKILLGFTRYSGQNLAVDAQVLDARGRVLASAGTSLASMFMEEEMAKGGKAIEPDKSEKPLKMSDESKTYYALMSRGIDGSRSGIEVLAEPLKSKVLNPEQFDPLSYGVTDLLLAAAEDRNKPLIVVLPDAAQNFDAASNVKANELFTQLQQVDLAIVEDVEGWLMGKPASPTEARRERVNRAAYGALIRQVTKTGSLTLGNLAAFAMAQGQNPGYDSFFIQNLYSLFGAALGGFDLSNWEAIRFYGALGDSGRKAIEGKTVAFQTLPKEAQVEVAKLVYKQPSLGMNMEVEVLTTPDESSAMLCMDPTERLPNGIPPDSVVRHEASSELVVFSIGGNASFPLGASEMASQAAMEERPDLFPWAQEQRIGNKFRTASRITLGFDFNFGQGLNQSIQLWDFQGHSKDTVSKGDLPAAFREQYEQFLKEMREAYKGMKSSDLRRGNGQPPPRP